MAKKKAKKDKLPKTIAGVKVPKELRKGGQFAKFMSDPTVREIALAAIGAALAARKETRQAARQAARSADGAASDAAESVGRSAGWLKAALGAAAVEAGRLVIDAIEDAGARKRMSANGKGGDNSSGDDERAEAGAGAAS